MSVSILRQVLGGTYGGPSISITHENLFCLYVWYDAPVGEEILVEAATWPDFLRRLQLYKKSGKKHLAHPKERDRATNPPKRKAR